MSAAEIPCGLQNASTPSNRRGCKPGLNENSRDDNKHSNHDGGEQDACLLPFELWNQCLHFCSSTRDLTALAKTCRNFRNVVLADAHLRQRRANPTRALLLYQSDGQSFEDVGPFGRATTVMHDPSTDPEGRTTVAVERMNITTGDFTILLRYRIPDTRHARGHGRQLVHDFANEPLFHDWCRPWSFRIEHHPIYGPCMDLRRNINSSGAQAGQGLVEASAWMNRHSREAMEQWISCAFTWQPGERELRCYCNGALRDAQFVRYGVGDVTIQQNDHPLFYIGWKNGDRKTKKLHGMVSHLAVFKKAFSMSQAMTALERLTELDGNDDGGGGNTVNSNFHDVADNNQDRKGRDSWWGKLLDDILYSDDDSS